MLQTVIFIINVSICLLQLSVSHLSIKIVSLLEYVAPQCYNPNVASVPGELDTNIAGLTLNPITPQTSSSCNIGLSSHRKDNNRYYIINFQFYDG